MGDSNKVTRSQEDDTRQQYVSGPHPHQHGSAPFQSQLEYLSTSQQPHSQNIGQYGQQSFDMAAMAGALPQGLGLHGNLAQQGFAHDSSQQNMAGSHPYGVASGMTFPSQRGPSFVDPAILARAQQQQFLGQQYGSPVAIQRQHAFQVPQQMSFSPVDPYGYGLDAQQYSAIDPRFAPQQFLVSGMTTEMNQYSRREPADNAPIPSYPRGPPRKPKQSGHALWVGNLPPAAQVMDLKDHFSRDATSDIESVFLIAKSNCAFVNYRTEAACNAAMSRFHDSRFHGVRLVCRLRRGTTTSSAAAPSEEKPDSLTPPKATPTNEEAAQDSGPIIARSPSGQSTKSDAEFAANDGPPQTNERVPEKYYIVKSLTAQDLEASVRNGIWATQSHNEQTLNRAFEQADNVYLIFSANKSGEYFGYARMTSPISGEPVSLTPAPAPEESSSGPTVEPQSISTPATATAPKGHIIDDSARGTIFWEADQSTSTGSSPAHESDGTSGGHNWGKQFSIEWVSTNKLPFYRTRGLRNPWNANREVKIARDGTELEPSVGKRLVQMFNRPMPANGNPNMVPQGGMPYGR